MPPLPFKSYHVYEAIPNAPLPDLFFISITSATYVSRHEIQQITVVPLRVSQTTSNHPLTVIVDPATNPGVEIVRTMSAYIGGVQTLPERMFIPHSQGKVSENVIKELKQKLTGWLDL